MNLIHKQFKESSLKGEWIIIIGNFDGFHLGHQALFELLLKEKKRLKANTGILTFDPHPKKFLQPKVPFYQIYEDAYKCLLFEQAGIDSCFVISFTRQFANLGPSEFIDKLFRFIRLKKIIVGYDFNFGKSRQGSVALLRQETESRGIEFFLKDPVQIDGITVSSTMIRRLLFEGDFNAAAKFLGRTWFIEGQVQKGQGLGRQIGFATINLEPKVLYPIRNGVYICEVELEGQRHPAVCNIGVKPTFQEKKYLVEAHLFNFSRTLYDKTVRIFPLKFIRDELPFENISQLTAQIQKDTMTSRNYFNL
ncbi:MAG: bifunctional riboflavin kinase/FAD synthetase [Deltaproteobacteria bacterium]|nr:bifunctional riboflavin kinase/FAD synthetase [Deltaproteobacteria bacterium]